METGIARGREDEVSLFGVPVVVVTRIGLLGLYSFEVFLVLGCYGVAFLERCGSDYEVSGLDPSSSLLQPGEYLCRKLRRTVLKDMLIGGVSSQNLPSIVKNSGRPMSKEYCWPVLIVKVVLGFGKRKSGFPSIVTWDMSARSNERSGCRRASSVTDVGFWRSIFILTRRGDK